MKSILVIFVAVVIGVAAFYEDIIAKVLIPQYIEWAQDIEVQGLKDGRPLTESEMILANEVGVKYPVKVRIVTVDLVPYPYENFALKILGESLGFIGEGIVNNAQVFGYSIYIRKGYALDTPKLAHELVHVLQIENSTFETITFQHLSDLAQYGYSDAPLEVEAFEANKKYAGH